MRALFLVLQSAWHYFVLGYFLYQVFIVILGVFYKAPKRIPANRQHRFVALVAARNEQSVVSHLIESLHGQDYPQELLDIVVIADNCTDDTAQVARTAGAFVYERFDETRKTKGFALGWGIEQLLRDRANKYDALCVFDADNLVSPQFFSCMNEELCKGNKVVQGYRDTKNPRDTWVSSSYAIYFWVINRFYNGARHVANLSAIINGTGFMVSMDLLKDKGWPTRTISEDTEFAIISIAQGYKVAFAPNAVVYDEQPITFIQSIKQRFRWAVGYLQCAKLYFFKLLKRFVLHFDLRALDALIYLIGIPVLFSGIVIEIVGLFIQHPPSLLRMLASILLFYAFPFSQCVMVLLLEKKPFWVMWRGVVTHPLFYASWLILGLSSVFIRNLAWKSIPHVQALSMDEAKDHVV